MKDSSQAIKFLCNIVIFWVHVLLNLVLYFFFKVVSSSFSTKASVFRWSRIGLKQDTGTSFSADKAFVNSATGFRAPIIDSIISVELKKRSSGICTQHLINSLSLLQQSFKHFVLVTHFYDKIHEKHFDINLSLTYSD